MKKKILLTNGDGSLGCGIARIIERYYSMEDIYTYSLSYKPISAINHYVDKVIIYPHNCIIDEEYDVGEIAKLCEKENIDLIVPVTDHECVLFSQYRNILPKVLCSNTELSLACYDKWLFYNLMKDKGFAFPDTCLPSNPKKFNCDYIVKPRKGGLSRGLMYNSPNLRSFSDEYIAQEQLRGTEVTVAFYKTLSNEIIGPFVGERTLFHGMTNLLKVIPGTKDINEFVIKFSKLDGLIGPCNIQGMLCDQSFIPFEINLRFSGTASLRDSFGFKDVICGIEEHLFNRKPAIQNDIKTGFAVRFFADLIYNDISEEKIINSSHPEAIIE